MSRIYLLNCRPDPRMLDPVGNLMADRAAHLASNRCPWSIHSNGLKAVFRQQPDHRLPELPPLR